MPSSAAPPSSWMWTPASAPAAPTLVHRGGSFPPPPSASSSPYLPSYPPSHVVYFQPPTSSPSPFYTPTSFAYPPSQPSYPTFAAPPPPSTFLSSPSYSPMYSNPSTMSSFGYSPPPPSTFYGSVPSYSAAPPQWTSSPAPYPPMTTGVFSAVGPAYPSPATFPSPSPLMASTAPPHSSAALSVSSAPSSSAFPTSSSSALPSVSPSPFHRPSQSSSALTANGRVPSPLPPPRPPRRRRRSTSSAAQSSDISPPPPPSVPSLQSAPPPSPPSSSSSFSYTECRHVCGCRRMSRTLSAARVNSHERNWRVHRRCGPGRPCYALLNSAQTHQQPTLDQSTPNKPSQHAEGEMDGEESPEDRRTSVSSSPESITVAPPVAVPESSEVKESVSPSVSSDPAAVSPPAVFRCRHECPCRVPAPREFPSSSALHSHESIHSLHPVCDHTICPQHSSLSIRSPPRSSAPPSTDRGTLQVVSAGAEVAEEVKIGTGEAREPRTDNSSDVVPVRNGSPTVVTAGEVAKMASVNVKEEEGGAREKSPEAKRRRLAVISPTTMITGSGMVDPYPHLPPPCKEKKVEEDERMVALTLTLALAKTVTETAKVEEAIPKVLRVDMHDHWPQKRSAVCAEGSKRETGLWTVCV